jgi:hypothetical protein
VGNSIGGDGAREGYVSVEQQPEYRDNNLQLVGTLENNRNRCGGAWISPVDITN